MTQPCELIEALRPIVAVLDASHTRFCIGGSVASSWHGAPRTTLDVDLAAELDEQGAKATVAALQGDYYVSESAALDAVRRRSCFNLLHLATAFKIDVFVSKDRDFDRSVQERAILAVLDGSPPLPVRMASAEDIVLTKLEWYRLGEEGSERQWNDVRMVTAVQAEQLDRPYLELWAQRLGVADLLRRLTAEVL
ncbi:MAG TPA: hypothetical protein VIY86_08135 [Pirellulaceae bacterium]